ncbi:MAG: M1 family metallopeptidase [Chloroflexota bacterium]
MTLAGFMGQAAPAHASQAKAIASYRIEATYDAQAKTIAGKEIITYLNDSPEALAELYLHLYLNAFKDENTTWMRESRGVSRGFKADPQRRGWTDVTAISIVNGPDLLAASQVDETILRVPLPAPLAAGQAIQLAVEWQAQLPRVFARTGFAGDFVLAGQWYPKMAVYDRGRWNKHQLHANSEFFADFGTYDVTITLPAELVVGATGLPQKETQNGDGTKTVSYRAQHVSDFVWTASPRYRSATRQVADTEVLLLYQPENEPLVPRYLTAAENALIYFGQWFGPYPHARLTVVDTPTDAGGAGGMEYPTLITAGMGIPGLPTFLSDAGEAHFLEMVTIHEAAHQWWPMLVATNEMEEPWMDEGFADYATIRLLNQLYGKETSVANSPRLKFGYLYLHRGQYAMVPASTVIYGRAWELKNYEVATYSKPALVLTTLEGYLGQERMLKVLQTYVQRWSWHHPRTEDFIAVVNEVSGEDMKWFFDGLVYGTGIVDYSLVRAETQRQKDGRYASKVVIERKGDVIIPVEILFCFGDGSTKREKWDGMGKTVEYTYSTPSPLVSAMADPQGKLAIELNVLDNGRTVNAQHGPWADLSSRWLFLMQQILQLIGFYG